MVKRRVDDFCVLQANSSFFNLTFTDRHQIYQDLAEHYFVMIYDGLNLI